MEANYILENGITALDITKMADKVKPEVYREIRKKFCSVMDVHKLNYNFGHNKSPEPTPDEVYDYYGQLLDRLAVEHKANGNSKLWKYWNAQLNEYSVDMFIFESSIEGTEFLIPELQDQTFTLQKVIGCDAYKYSCGGGRYVTPHERKQILDHTAHEAGVV